MSRRTEHEHDRVEPVDEELVAAIRRSDEDSFAVLYDRYYRRVYNFVYLRLRNHADTEEAVQDAFTAAFRSIASFSGRSSVLAWIYGIAKNTVNNHIRRAVALERRVERAEAEMVRNLQWSTAGTPEEDLTLRRCADSVRDELAKLSGWQSDVFEMRHSENLPIAEISVRTARSHDAVRSSLFRVKRRIVIAIETGHAAGVDTDAGRSLA